MDYEKRRQRKQDVAERAAYADSMYSYCRIIGCRRPTTSGAGKGLNRLYCRSHEDFHERHGSYTKRSYTAAELAPHRKAAQTWLQAHETDLDVRLAIRAVEGLYRRAGPPIEAFRLRGLSPVDRARVAWARLREAGVDPRRALVAWLAVKLITEADPQAERKVEFKRVQVAKLVHRMASGSHKRWERRLSDGRVVVQRLDEYPQSRGRVLRYLGQQIERAAELLSGARP